MEKEVIGQQKAVPQAIRIPVRCDTVDRTAQRYSFAYICKMNCGKLKIMLMHWFLIIIINCPHMGINMKNRFILILHYAKLRLN